jgi:predicted ATPase
MTGGPGSGKSTLIEGMALAGYATSVEAGRGIIQDQVAIDGLVLPWRDPVAFSEMMLCWDMRSYHVAQKSSGLVLFDRGVPDVIGYLRLLGLPVPKHMMKAAEIFRYNQRVFIAPPWPEIYEQDTERKQDLEEAERTYISMFRTYTELGYELIELPRFPIQERMQFLTDALPTVSCPE